MDAISHALLSFILGKALQLDTNLQLLLIVSSISLDIDAFSIRSPEAALQTHRGPVHSILAALLASAVISLGFAVFMRLPTTALLSVVLLCLTGTLSHLALDLPATGNMTALWPLSKRNLALNLTHYIDPATLGALIIAALLAIYAPTDVSTSKTVAAATIAFLTVNFGARSYQKHVATKTIRKSDSSTTEIISLPTLRPDRWWTIKKTPFENGYRYEIHQIDSIHKRTLNTDTVKSPYISYSGPMELPIDSPQKAVALSKKDKRIGKYIEKLLLPTVTVSSSDQETWKILWYDVSTHMGKKEPQGMIANVKTNGTIIVDEHRTHTQLRTSRCSQTASTKNRNSS